jgi:hypothetical protein
MMTDDVVDDAIVATLNKMLDAGIPKHDCQGDLLWRAIYRDGLAAGLERAAKVCDKWAENALSKQDGKLYDVDTNLRMMAIGPQDCATAIRALNAASPAS